ncbi:unnamed protein product [Orchesella dallaii]|uniref:Uncharacterized protein n=1 Tax=Orchesella dallaii TaxID=48710 RepID=A0ABP1RHW4_9HEXA
MEMDANSKLQALVTSEKVLLEENITLEDIRKEKEILKEKLKASESEGVRLSKKRQSLIEELGRLMDETNTRLKSNQEATMKQRKRLHEIDKLIEKCRQIMQDDFQKANKFKPLTLQEYQLKAFKEFLQSNRKLVAKNLHQTRKTTQHLTGLEKKLQKKRSELQIDHVNVESQIRNDNAKLYRETFSDGR